MCIVVTNPHSEVRVVSIVVGKTGVRALPSDRVETCGDNREMSTFVGIDLGTLYTTALGGGGRICFTSEVGFARDSLAQRLVGAGVVVGDEIQANRSALQIVRPFEFNALKYALDEPRYERLRSETNDRSFIAASALVRHAIAKLGISASQSDFRCVVGAPATSSSLCRSFLRSLVEGVSPHVAVVSEPFAVAYGAGVEAVNSVVVDIGAGTVDYCYFCGAFPRGQEQSTLPVGGDHVDADLRNLILHDYPEIKMTQQMARQIKEKYGDVGSRERRVVVTLPTDDSFSSEFDLTAHVRKACTRFAAKIAEGLAEQIKAIDIDEFLRFGGKVLLAGGGSQLAGLEEYITAAVKTPKPLDVIRIHDWRYAGAQGALVLAQLLDEEAWQILTRIDSSDVKAAA